jgi:TolB-like protein/DNA-binding winged helix-turn-helix (wHTH) protein/tetratricopeptide (TPR) repeat protein
MMSNPQGEQELFAFGAYTLDPGQRLLLRGDDVVQLEPKVFETLVALVEGAGRVLTKDELVSRIWPDTFVEEGSLTRNVSTLRRVLGDDSDGQGYIETLARRGYRFRVPVRRVTSQVADAPAPATPTTTVQAHSARMPWFRRRVLVLAGAIVLIFAFAAVARTWYARVARDSHPRRSISSIAVLPLQNLSGDPAQEFFSDGMTEALISQLARTAKIRVTSRTSVAQFKHSAEPVPEIARKLGVDALVEGSVQRSGNRVRVTVQLIDAATDSHIWAREFDGTTSDLLALQRQIALGIVGDMAEKIRPSDAATTRLPSISPEAYDAYLLGQYHGSVANPDSVRMAVADYRKSIALEPNFAPAHAALAMILFEMHGAGLSGVSLDEIMMEARTAVALDDNLAAAHVALAGAAFELWDWETTEREYERALAIDPGADACACYSLVLSAFGRHDRAVAMAGRAATTNPLSSGLHTHYGMVLTYARQYDAAERHLKLALEIEPANFVALWSLGELYKTTGRSEQALSLFQAPQFADPPMLAYAYAAAGRRIEARQILAKVQRNPASIDFLTIAMVHLHLGETDRGFEWLERAVDRHVGPMRFLKVHPAFDPWRKDPRFAALVERLHLPPVES